MKEYVIQWRFVSTGRYGEQVLFSSEEREAFLSFIRCLEEQFCLKREDEDILQVNGMPDVYQIIYSQEEGRTGDLALPEEIVNTFKHSLNGMFGKDRMRKATFVFDVLD